MPNALDSAVYSHTNLITPPSYLASNSSLLLTPSLSRSSGSTNKSRSDSDSELDDDDDNNNDIDEMTLRDDIAAWTPDQDEALLSVMFQFCQLLTNSGLFYALGWTRTTVDAI
jgi:hypothetical protein